MWLQKVRVKVRTLSCPFRASTLFFSLSLLYYSPIPSPLSPAYVIFSEHLIAFVEKVLQETI